VNRWQAMMKSNSKSRKVVRALRLRGAASEKSRSFAVTVGFSGGARKATEKSAEQDGDDGVTTIAGSGDFSPICSSGTSLHQKKTQEL
jgi:hypothetical protein